jgi:hypothetical protein
MEGENATMSTNLGSWTCIAYNHYKVYKHYHISSYCRAWSLSSIPIKPRHWFKKKQHDFSFNKNVYL